MCVLPYFLFYFSVILIWFVCSLLCLLFLLFSLLLSGSSPVRIKLLPCKYGLLTKGEVNMAGYWPSSFFACLWTETKLRSINSQKKRTRPTSSHLDRTNLVNKGFIIWLLVKFFLRDTAGSPKRAR